MEKFKYINPKKISSLPQKTGVYIFKKGKDILYIGKSTNIRKRVKNHFKSSALKDNLFVKNVSKIGWMTTDSEIESLIKEFQLIKKHQPQYNVVWKDDKNYFFVSITNEEFPRIFITHQPESTSTIIGPFVDGKALKQTLNVLRKIFPFRTCKKIPPHPCLWHHLARCPAPCLLNQKLIVQLPKIKKSINDESQKNAKYIKEILQGKKKQVLNNLKKEMKRFSKNQEFEKAAKIRDQITYLNRVLSHSKIYQSDYLQYELIKPWHNYHPWEKTNKILKEILKIKKRIKRIEAYDISNIQGKTATGSMIVFISGKPIKNLYRQFKIKMENKPNDTAMIKEILTRRLKHPEWTFPDVILIDGGKAQLNAGLKIIKSRNHPALVKRIKVTALAKKENKLYIENRKKPLFLKNLPQEISNLILYLRDEAHRFAISYHRRLRMRGLLKNN